MRFLLFIVLSTFYIIDVFTQTACDSVSYRVEEERIVIDTISAPIYAITLFDSDYRTYGFCTSWDIEPCDFPVVFDSLDGVFHLKIQTFNSEWKNECDIFEEYAFPYNPVVSTQFEILDAGQVKLFPNPARYFTRVEFNKQEKGVILVYTVYGELIYREPIASVDNYYLDLSRFRKGQYIFQILNENKALMSKRFTVK